LIVLFNKRLTNKKKGGRGVLPVDAGGRRLRADAVAVGQAADAGARRAEAGRVCARRHGPGVRAARGRRGGAVRWRGGAAQFGAVAAEARLAARRRLLPALLWRRGQNRGL